LYLSTTLLYFNMAMADSDMELCFAVTDSLRDPFIIDQVLTKASTLSREVANSGR
jgi:hypothetical protein